MNSAEFLRVLVPVMRELGVAQAFGIILGPRPEPTDRLRAEHDQAETEEERAAIEARLKAARATEAKAERLQEMRDLLASSGREYTDEELERML